MVQVEGKGCEAKGGFGVTNPESSLGNPQACQTSQLPHHTSQKKLD